MNRSIRQWWAGPAGTKARVLLCAVTFCIGWASLWFIVLLGWLEP